MTSLACQEAALSCRSITSANPPALVLLLDPPMLVVGVPVAIPRSWAFITSLATQDAALNCRKGTFSNLPLLVLLLSLPLLGV